VLRGRDFFSHATPDANDEASELFQRAIDLDPNYADAYAALGGSHYEAVISGWSQFREEELEQAEALAKKALAFRSNGDASLSRARGYRPFQKTLRACAGTARPCPRNQSQRRG
jgi:tetratricopeptide (TPR) repeat protein